MRVGQCRLSALCEQHETGHFEVRMLDGLVRVVSTDGEQREVNELRECDHHERACQGVEGLEHGVGKCLDQFLVAVEIGDARCGHIFVHGIETAEVAQSGAALRLLPKLVNTGEHRGHLDDAAGLDREHLAGPCDVG